MDENDDLVSSLNSLKSKIEDMEVRVGEVLMKQLQTKKELDLIMEKPEGPTESVVEEEIQQLSLDDDFTGSLRHQLKDLLSNQQAWLETVQKSKENKTGLKGQKLLQEMNDHFSERFEFLKLTRSLVEGPLLEDPPPPPPPEVSPVEEEPKEDKKTKKKGKGKK